MKGNYDHAAFFYDRLNWLVLGRSVTDAQQYLAVAIPAGARVLIAGGGSGWILEAIAAIHPAGLTITYADPSARMMALARRRNAGGNQVTFITAPVETAGLSAPYDVVFTPFLFDNFGEVTADAVFACIDRVLLPGGLWLYCDFAPTGLLWHRVLLGAMYAFFRLLCGIEAHSLPHMARHFAVHGYNTAAQQDYMRGFIVAQVYGKQGAGYSN